MTLADMIHQVRARERAWKAAGGTDMAQLLAAITTLLSTPEPCGWPRPQAHAKNEVFWEGVGTMSSDDARGIAVMLLAAADEAER